MVATATVRVPVHLRDELATLARERHQSIPGYLADLIRERQREAIMRAARREASEIAESAEALVDFAAWEGSLGDGIE